MNERLILKNQIAIMKGLVENTREGRIRTELVNQIGASEERLKILDA